MATDTCAHSSYRIIYTKKLTVTVASNIIISGTKFVRS